MLRLIRKNLAQRPLRYLLTGFTIAFSVSTVAAVFIFTGGLRTTFDRLASDIESGYDISVRPNVTFGADSLAPSVPVDHVERIQAVPDVAIVQPRIVGAGVIAVDGDGEPTTATAGPNLGILWGTENPDQTVFLQEGRPPNAPDEFALDIDAFDSGNYELGGRYRVIVPRAQQQGLEFELVGTFTFGDPDDNALVGAQLVAFEANRALELINRGEGWSDITVVLDAGADIDSAITDISAVVDENLEVQTREEVVADTQGDFGQILDIFQTVLLVFAVIILFVSSFLIYNVFSITLGQRIRELGLLRALGASGTQTTQLMMGEALLMGALATGVGIPGGLGLAWLLRAALNALGFPDDTGLPLQASTIVWAIFTGMGVTILAAAWPSIQARRVSPMSALRDGAELTEIQSAHHPPFGVALSLLGGSSIGLSFALSGWAPRLLLPVFGGLVLFAGVSLISKPVSKFVLMPLGVSLMLITLFTDPSLGEVFGSLGAGAGLTMLGANQLNPFVAPAATSLLGRWPTAIVVGFIGVILGMGGLFSLATAGLTALFGVPGYVNDSGDGRVLIAVGGLVAGSVITAAGWALVRTALGSRRLTGHLARLNAARNPQRTSTTAAALMIGLSLVSAVTVIGDSIKSSVTNALSTSISADWLLQEANGGPGSQGFPAAAAERIDRLDEVESVLQFRVAFPAAWATSETGDLNADDFAELLPLIQTIIDGDDADPAALAAALDQVGSDIDVEDAAAVDFSTLDAHVNPDWVERDDSLVGPNAIYIDDSVADDKGLATGDTFSALFPDLQSEDLVVAGIYRNSFVLGNRVMTLEMWDRHLPGGIDQFLTLVTAPGVDPEVARRAIEGAISEDFPTIEVFDKDEFAANSERQINQTLATINVLLGLSGVIAALGIFVSLALSVYERTREIGLLRAVGTTRQQTRWMIRWEGSIIAAFGGLTGVVLGVGVGSLVTNKMPEFLVTTTSFPVGTLVVYVVFAALVGLFAAVFPAILAGRLNVLDAIATE